MTIRNAGQVRGNPNDESTLRSDLAYNQATVQKLSTNRDGLDVLSNLFVQLVASDSVDSYASGVITAAAHSAKVGDLVQFTSGTCNQQTFTVYAVATNTITLAQTPNQTPATLDTFDILRFAYPRVSTAGVVSVSATVSSGVNIQQLNGNTIDLGNGATGAGTQRVTLSSDSTGQVKLAAGANTIGALTANQSVNVSQMNGVAVSMGNGVSGTGVQRVVLASDNTANSNPWLVSGAGASGAAVTGNPVLVAGSDGTNARTLNTDSSGRQVAVGAAAHGATAAGNPVLVAGYAGTSNPTAVSNGQAAQLLADTIGRQIVFPYTNPENLLQGKVGWSDNLQHTVIAAQGAGVRTYLTSVTVSNANSATSTDVFLQDGVTSLYNFQVPANSTVTITFPAPLRGSANTAWNFVSSAGVATLLGNASGFKSSI